MVSRNPAPFWIIFASVAKKLSLVLVFVIFAVLYKVHRDKEDDARKKHQVDILAVIDAFSKQLSDLAVKGDYDSMFQLCEKHNFAPSYPMAWPNATVLDCQKGARGLIGGKIEPPVFRLMYFEGGVALKEQWVKVVEYPTLERGPMRSPARR